MEEKVSISISKETHTRLKEYCDERAFKISNWADFAIREKLDNLNK